MSGARPVSRLLGSCDRLLQRSRLLARLQTRMESVVGPELSRHCRIQNLRDDTLILQTDAPIWANRLRFSLPTLLEQLRGQPELQQLRDIQVRIVPQEAPRAKSRSKAHLSTTAASMLRNAANGTTDPALREALRRLADNCKKGEAD